MLYHNISDAKANLSHIMKLVEEGKEVLIGRNGKPIGKIVPYVKEQTPFPFGALKGQIWIADDFDSQETSDEMARLFGMID